MDGSNRGERCDGAMNVAPRPGGHVEQIAGAELDAYEEAMHHLATRVAVQAATAGMFGGGVRDGGWGRGAFSAPDRSAPRRGRGR